MPSEGSLYVQIGRSAAMAPNIAAASARAPCTEAFSSSDTAAPWAAAEGNKKKTKGHLT